LALIGGTAAFASTTIANNSAMPGAPGSNGGITVAPGTGQGGGFYVGTITSTLRLKNTLVANNSATSAGPDVFGQVVSQQYNLVSNGVDVTGFSVTDIISQPVTLGMLQDNGGATPTHHLLGFNLARNGGNPTGCTDLATPTPQILATDQRGRNRTVSGRCDIGAFEVERPTFVVNSSGDSADATLGDMVCAVPTSNLCTFRAAIQEVNAFGEGDITFNLVFPATINIGSALPTLAGNLTVETACGTDGPRITLVGSSGVSGVHLAGGVRWYGVSVRGFAGPQMRLDNSLAVGRNNLNCVKVDAGN
jgi:hypothetical protein